MKIIPKKENVLFWFLLLFISLVGCKKNDIIPSQNAIQPKASLEVVQQVPPEILESMYADYLKNNEVQKAKNLRLAYDFTTGNRIAKTEIKPYSSLPGVGNILDYVSFVESSGSTQAHIQDLGWVTYNFDNMNGPFAPNAFDNTAPSSGQYMGTVGQGKRLEAFKLPGIRFTQDNGLHLSSAMWFKYRAYMQNYGWLPYVYSSDVAGIPGQSLRMEAFEINVMPNYVDMDSCTCLFQPKVYYRAQVQSIGWQPWVSGGQTAGTTGRSLRVEAMQVRVYILQ